MSPVRPTVCHVKGQEGDSLSHIVLVVDVGKLRAMLRIALSLVSLRSEYYWNLSTYGIVKCIVTPGYNIGQYG